MALAPGLSIVIPAYNEALRLERTVRDAVRYCGSTGRSFELIVVDDGSGDDTSGVAAALSREYPEIRLLRLAQNHGKGYAVRSGVVNARGRLVLFADADGATPIEELERLQQAIAGGAEVAIGSRALESDRVTVRVRWYRRAMGRTFHRLVETLTVRGFRDTQCGFKLFLGPVAHELFSRMRMTGFSFDVEVLMMAQRMGYRVAEVPVNWTHQPGSRVNLATDSLRMAWDLFLIRSHCMRGGYERPHVTPLRAAPDEPAASTVAAREP